MHTDAVLHHGLLDKRVAADKRWRGLNVFEH